MELMKRLFFRYQNMIPNALLILELMEIGLKRRNHQISRGIFMRIMGIVMGTNLAPILANICIYSNVKRRTMYYMYTEKYHMA